jgi:hypothetical protein
MQMIDGDMQPFSLTLNKFLEYAAKWHPKSEVVTEHGRYLPHAQSAPPVRPARSNGRAVRSPDPHRQWRP